MYLLPSLTGRGWGRVSLSLTGGLWTGLLIYVGKFSVFLFTLLFSFALFNFFLNFAASKVR